MYNVVKLYSLITKPLKHTKNNISHRKGVVIEIHGIRLLDAQLATGGLIDPVAGYRIPPSVALERKLLDQRLAEILTNKRNDMGLKGYYDPNSG